ncbi:MAG: hypothetical protein K2F81_02975 [Ruminococcus sp.]|nr:hypothetical protein [Ruminococcus sp.]
MNESDKINKNSQAKIQANARYTAKTYKQLKVSVKPEDYEIIANHCTDHKISKAKFIVAACKYCIDNHIDLNNINTNKE